MNAIATEWRLIHFSTEVMEKDSSGPDDDAMLRDFRSGEPDALTRVLRRYESPLLGFLCGFVGSRALAQDIAQETFLRLVARPPRSLPHGSLKPWLFRVARNRAVDVLRREKRFSGLESAPECRSEDRQDRLSPDDAAFVIRQLPEIYREVVALRIYGGLSFEEISRELGVPLGTALWRMRHALGLMRNTLEADL